MLKKTSTNEDTALHEAVRNNHPQVVEILIREKPEFANMANAAGESPLYLAALLEYKSIAVEILNPSSVAYTGPNGRTALHEAVISKDKVLLLNDGKSAAYIGDKSGKTPLHIAIFHGKSHLKVAEKIMAGCPDCCDLVDNRGRNVLHFAVQSKSSEGVKTIIEKPSLANLINQKDKKGNTPVHLLATYGFEEYCLAEHHLVDKKAINNENLAALDVVVKTKDESDEPFLGRTKRKLKKVGYKPGRPSIIQLAERDDMSRLDNELIIELEKT
ncbi:ankyrin repeat-containing protein At2g01680-like [Hevea brasiliensis]|uniref:ankyrin repeat-containing protein At2g01680-like n=1 Tax=Hevea brasiliensis TaxID=3981 RepID=UPI0025FA9B8B|nr:ankyrin repeat-containing protein At2g01680-like [Hevea brasiliensis]